MSIIWIDDKRRYVAETRWGRLEFRFLSDAKTYAVSDYIEVYGLDGSRLDWFYWRDERSGRWRCIVPAVFGDEVRLPA